MIYTSLLEEPLYITIVDKLPFFGNFLLREYYYSPIVELHFHHTGGFIHFSYSNILIIFHLNVLLSIIKTNIDFLSSPYDVHSKNRFPIFPVCFTSSMFIFISSPCSV